jgi:hypothetical protein
LVSRLDEQQRRWFVAWVSALRGRGGIRELAQITGMDEKTIWRGRSEMATELQGRPTDRVRLPGGGRPRLEKKTPQLLPLLKEFLEAHAGGDPMSTRRWVRLSLRQLRRALRRAGHRVSPPTIARWLRALHYALRANVKSEEPGSRHRDREAQFEHIAQTQAQFLRAACPVISVDTKKKELVGNFKNPGRLWCQAPERVNGHDFLSEGVGRAVPYGIYDLERNRGFVCVGQSADTPEFAVDAIAQWWASEGQAAYPHADRLLILADGGGSNGARPRRWKQQLQRQLADRLRLTVSVCHYPTGCSKYNPIERRLFSAITRNWAGIPLRSFQTVLQCLRGTTTETGLKVKAFLMKRTYAKGQKVTDAEMRVLNLVRDAVCPNWNYTIHPRSASTCGAT